MARFGPLTVALLNLLLLIPASAVGPWCFSCTDVFHPAICQSVVQCGEHEKCVTERRLSNNGGELYSSGCKADADCSNATAAAIRVSDPNVLCSTCCDGTLCNEDGCGAPTIRDQSRLFCVNCGFVQNARDCDTVDLCSADEVCSISIKSQFNLDFLQLGCLPKTSCPAPTATLASDKALCCDSDLCNSNDLGVDPSIYTTTPKPSPGPATATFDNTVFTYNKTHAPGETMDLLCRVTGGPAPTVTWTVKNATGSFAITSGVSTDQNRDSVLSIPSPDKSDTGIYTCIADNILARDSAVMNVTVLSPPAIAGPLNQTIVANAKTNVVLLCDADNDTSTKVRWEIPPEVKSYSISANNTLTLYNVHYENEAVYKCVAENADGKQEKRYTLKINDTNSQSFCSCPTPPPVSCPPAPSCPTVTPVSCPTPVSLLNLNPITIPSYLSTQKPATANPPAVTSSFTQAPTAAPSQFPSAPPNTPMPTAYPSQSTPDPLVRNQFQNIFDRQNYLFQCPSNPGYPVMWSRQYQNFDYNMPYYSTNQYGQLGINTLGSFYPTITGVYECQQAGTPLAQYALYLPIQASCFDTFASPTQPVIAGSVVRASCGECPGPFPVNPALEASVNDLLCVSAMMKGVIPYTGGNFTYVNRGDGRVKFLNENGSGNLIM